MERGIFLQRLQGGLKDWPGVQIIFQATRIAGSWSFWYEAFFKCGGFNSRDRICVRDLDGKFDQYERSINPAERKRLAEEIQHGFEVVGRSIGQPQLQNLASTAPRALAQTVQCRLRRRGRCTGTACGDRGCVVPSMRCCVHKRTLVIMERQNI